MNLRAPLFFMLSLISLVCFSQYPATNTMINDVKAQNTVEFVTITPIGSWSMFHDKVPNWQQPDACRHEVNIIGKKNVDGSFWTYKALAIYHKVGSGFTFNRLFIIEDATKLNGLNLPDNNYFLKIFMDKLENRDNMFMATNYEMKNATAFYSFEIKETPVVSGTGSSQFVEFVVEVCLDLPNGIQIEKKIVPIKVRAKKIGEEFVFQHALKKNDGKVIEMKEFETSDDVNKLQKYGSSDKTLNDFLIKKE